MPFSPRLRPSPRPYWFPAVPAVDVYVNDWAGDFVPPTSVTRISANTGLVTHWQTGYGEGLAVDGLGNVFVAGVPGISGLLKAPTEGGAQTVVGPEQPTSTVAVDAGGNAYTIDNSNQVWKIPPPDGPPTVVWASSGQTAWDVAVDMAANLYVMLHTPTTVVRIPADGGSPTVINLAGIFASETPWAFAVDPSGQYAYLGDWYAPSAVKVPLGGGPYTGIGPEIGVFGTGAIAADAFGNAYIADSYGGRVLMVFPSGEWATIYETAAPASVAVQLAPLPRWRPPEEVAILLGDIIADGGGWIVIGDRFVPIPPRSPAIPLIARAALPYLDQAIENRQLGNQLRDMR